MQVKHYYDRLNRPFNLAVENIHYLTEEEVSILVVCNVQLFVCNNKVLYICEQQKHMFNFEN